MKIAEQVIDNKDGTITVKKTHDNDPALRAAQYRRETGTIQPISDSYCVGVVPTYLIFQWLKEAGVDASDSDAAGEVISRKMMSGEFDKFRVWEGKY